MLTVVIPSYNHSQYILECLRAACDIDIAGLKVLVIDDGSTDNTVRVVKDFVENGTTVPVELIEKRNSGLVSSLNLSLECVDTEFIYLCASDDIPVSDGVKFCTNILLKDSKSRYVIGGAKNFATKSEFSKTYGEHQEYFLNLPPEVRQKMCFFNYPSPILIQSTIFRTKTLRDLGGWDPELKLDDYPFFIDLFKKYPKIGRDFKYLPDVITVLYRQHPSNSYKDTFRQFELVREVIESRAPNEFKARAVANCASSYMVTSIKRNRLRDFFNIFSSLRCAYRLLVVFYFPLQVLYKINRKIMRL